MLAEKGSSLLNKPICQLMYQGTLYPRREPAESCGDQSVLKLLVQLHDDGGWGRMIDSCPQSNCNRSRVCFKPIGGTPIA